MDPALSESEIEEVRHRLLLRGRGLLRRWNEDLAEQEELLSAREADWEDLAALQQGGRLVNRLEAAEVRELEAIAAALRRMDEGTYGLCARCGAPIEGSRLMALPETPVCAECAQELEERLPEPPGEA